MSQLAHDYFISVESFEDALVGSETSVEDFLVICAYDCVIYCLAFVPIGKCATMGGREVNLTHFGE